MINEIRKLHHELNDNEEILIKPTRYDHNTIISKDDTIQIAGRKSNILKVIKPDGEIRLINMDQIVIVYMGRRRIL